ncbi:type I-C CRISPR-associated protein Cas7/Csd2 [Paucilactobacillus suebicus]|uniref:CRISPR-associated protein, Csd2 family n=1 Tax=Paucilactobacillus suebicus DSM 5007 = KCTC 3549 TaxID=1423807 RepID=A0A0R1W3C8_9LACO|nr:type I-C CRISPR-associated protein Cas7/Csd2 [Paucilactobacillus suebicus]KRM12368.1 CRISPR-associated protein, Csd2 family [Paucilactobacillus suebicus DSM 5007 = KCTC 3549]
MTKLENRIDFTAVIGVKNANPNGDPLADNMPRVNNQGKGIITDVALKRKIRNAMLDQGGSVYVQSDDYSNDDYKDMRSRLLGNKEIASVLSENDATSDEGKPIFYKTACEQFLDVRAFGALFAFSKGKKDGLDGAAIGIRGPVSIQMAESIKPIDVTDMQITKSTSAELKDNGARGSDTMGHKQIVEFGVYKFSGSIRPNLAEKTQFSLEDSELLKQALLHMFDNDASASRPAGSMQLLKVVWSVHDNKLGQYPQWKVEQQVSVEYNDTASDFENVKIKFNALPNLKNEEF